MTARICAVDGSERVRCVICAKRDPEDGWTVCRGCHDRFFAKVRRAYQAGCWIWYGSQDGGRGRFATNGKVSSAQVVSLAIAGRVCDLTGSFEHLCEIPECVNPDHLKPKLNTQRASTVERFWMYAGDAGKRPSECWEWTGPRNTGGYGRLASGRRGKFLVASRFAWELMRGPIPNGHDICHKCDNPPCVNPNHLFTGTRRDNHADMLAKGRHPAAASATCRRGHPFDEENTRWMTSPRSGNQVRSCRECVRVRRAIKKAATS